MKIVQIGRLFLHLNLQGFSVPVNTTLHRIEIYLNKISAINLKLKCGITRIQGGLAWSTQHLRILPIHFNAL